ncbi:MAG TPA: alkaline phosphatase family protein [Bacillota bacterium]|nr:sulfatase-like hydrolase/transferase [Bacillota bacterium]HOB87798.1 alkaline phosphatase family protein [Bacillota bacterium]HOP69705.1 alkaline phosphatase family protein [Bacillota bacterium]HPT34575.1 alkaline phosphatase family protein [Bacillota bacterium]HQD05388.1 alkaline phosphatase family protein [Bacillota bacterium]
MRKKRWTVWFLIWVAALAAGLGALAYTHFKLERAGSPFGQNPVLEEEISPFTEPMAQNVYLILIDGMRADSLPDMPFVQSLADMGSSGVIVVEEPTFSRPAYARIITGASSSISNIKTNDQARKLNLPNLFDLARFSGLKTGGSLYYWFYELVVGPPYRTGDSHENRFFHDEEMPLQSGYFYDDFNYQYNDREIFEYGIRIMRDYNPNFLVVHTMELDMAGHNYGGASPKYREILRMNDRQIQEFVQAIPDPENSVVIITGDHGHIDAGGHGGPEKEASRVPLVIFGKGVKKGALPQYSQLDLAPTIAAILGMPFSRYMAGSIMEEAFDWTEAVLAEKRELLKTTHAGFVQELYAQLGLEEAVDGEATVAAALDRVRAETIKRRVLVAVILLLLLGGALVFGLGLHRRERRAKLFRGSRVMPAQALLSTALYAAVFHLVFYGIGLGYSFSKLNTVAHLAVKMPLAVLASYLVLLALVLLLSRFKANFRIYARHTGFIMVFLAALILGGALLQGDKGFILPDYRYYMLTFFSSLHLALFALFSLLGGGIMLLLNRFKGKGAAEGEATPTPED